ncbi:MAG: relaxase domain-containing protein [Deltaproteobacteria bacterium]|nr:relaxase domain-containing protein [Deltaproteobacteria bacterium]
MVAATFRYDTSRNLDPQLHTHAVVANMVQGEDGKWRTMVNDGLYRNKMAIGAVYRAELARGVKDLGYGIEKTHGDGRSEISGVSRDVVEGFSTRRAEIETAMAARNEGAPLENPKLADRAALTTRAIKRDVDKGELRRSWERQAAEIGVSAEAVRARARRAERERRVPDLVTDRGQPTKEAAAWAVAHLSERPGGVRPRGSSGGGAGPGAGGGGGRGGGAGHHRARTGGRPPCREGSRIGETLDRLIAAARSLSTATYVKVPEADGFLFQSRFTGHVCAAVFDRAFGKLAVVDITPLVDHVDFLQALIDYGITLTTLG